MDKTMNIALVISAVDSASRVINRMTNENAKRLQDLQKKTDAIANKAFNVGKQTGIMGAAIAAPLVYATKEAIGFEDKMADVAKVMNVSIGSGEFQRIGNEVKELSGYLAQTPEDAAELFANLAQGGVAAQDVAKVAKLAGEVGVAFGISAGQAGESFIKLRNAMGITIDETAKVTDALNHLGNNTAASSAQLFEFLSAGGAGAARNLGLAGQEAAAFGALLISNGKSAAEAGTIFERTMKGIYQNAEMKAIFDKGGRGIEGLVAVMEKGSKMDTDSQQKFFRQFGAYGTDISMFAKNFGQLQDTIGLVSDEQNYYNSSLLEFQNRQKTTAVQIEKMKTQFSILAIEIGSALLPALNQILQAVAPLIKGLSDWMKQNPELVAGIAKTAAVVAGLLLSISAVSFAIGGVVKVFMIAAKAFMFLKTAISVVVAVFKVLAFVLNINPIVLIITAIAAAAYLMYKHWDKIKGFFVKLWDDIKALFWKAVDWVKEFGILFIGPIGFIIKYWDDIIEFFGSMGSKFYEAGANIISSIVDGIKSRATALVDTVKNVAQKVRDFFPFSPAKTGPLTDIHRVKLMETVAQSVKAAPLVNAVESAAGSARTSIGGTVNSIASTAGGGGGGGMNLTFAPEITINGAANETDILSALREYAPQMLKEFQRLIELNDRKSFT